VLGIPAGLDILVYLNVLRVLNILLLVNVPSLEGTFSAAFPP